MWSDYRVIAKGLFFLALFFCENGSLCTAAWADKGSKVEYVRLPLLTFGGNGDSSMATTVSSLVTSLVLQSQNGVGGKGNVSDPDVINGTNINISELIQNLTGISEEDEEEVDSTTGNGKSIEEEAELKELDEEQESETDDKDEDEENGNEDQFNELDLIELVQELEHQADLEEQTGIFPEILEILHGKQHGNKGVNSTASSPTTSTIPTTNYSRDSLQQEGISNITLYKSGVVSRTNGTLRISLNEDGDLQLGSAEDLSQLSDEIAEGISEGVEEYLRMSDGIELDEDLMPPRSDNATAETRQFSLYLFQGQYYAEPRLNRFIDGALRNMATELRVASMDPLYFRVLPRGQVAERNAPFMASGGGGGGAGGIRRRRPGNGGGGGALAVGRHVRLKRQLPAFFRLQPNKKKQQQNKINRLQQGKKHPQQLRAKKNRFKLPAGITRITSVGGTNIFLKRKRQQQDRLKRQRQRRQRIRQQRLKQQLKNRRKKQQQNKNKLNKNQNKQLLNRIRRRIRQDVGGGRIEGLSRVQRDGDAEMQLFGNYTLIRSHMKIGPVEITMQFRTKAGIRRSGATLPVIRAHTVTRVNHEGSEMVDYLLDRPNPESIRVRGSLYPMAQKVAKNIFARLFLPNSFLVSRLREKASLAFLSKPVVA